MTKEQRLELLRDLLLERQLLTDIELDELNKLDLVDEDYDDDII